MGAAAVYKSPTDMGRNTAGFGINLTSDPEFASKSLFVG
jgi:uncharacterized protein (UPF0371 family)